MVKFNKKSIVALFLAAIFLLAAVSGIFTGSYADDNKGIIPQSVFGGGLSDGNGHTFLREAELFPEDKGRIFNAEEMFRSGLRFSEFYGEAEATWLFKERNANLSSNDKLSEQAKNRIKDRGGNWGIQNFFSQIRSMMANFTIGLSARISSFVSSVTTSLFDPVFFGTGGLAKIVGGETNEDGGVVRTLANGIYYPLLVMAGLAAAAYIAYVGIAKREFRKAIQSTIWIVVAVLIGVAIAERPATLARAPQNATSTLTGCILDGLQGKSCLDGSSKTKPSSFIPDVCISGSNSNVLSKSAAYNVNNLSCGIWKALVLDPWSEAQFGYRFDDLYTKNPPDGGKLYNMPSDGTVTADQFCVARKTPSSLKDIMPRPRKENFKGNEVCNVAFYQLATTTGLVDKTTGRTNLALLASNDETMFSSWSSGSGRYGMTVRSLLASIFAALTIVTITLRAHVYSFLATATIAFGPLFALFAVHPGKGRRLFLGWVESIVSYILKYLFTALVVIVTIILFSTIVGSVGGFKTLIAAIVLSSAMKMYQKEFVEMLGKVEMGGQKVSDGVANRVFDKTNRAKDMVATGAGATAGALVGAKLAAKANNVNTGDNFRERFAYYGGAVKDTALRKMNSSGNSMVRHASRQTMRQGQEIKRAQNQERADLQRSSEMEQIAGEFGTKMGSQAQDVIDKSNEKVDQANLEGKGDPIKETREREDGSTETVIRYKFDPVKLDSRLPEIKINDLHSLNSGTDKDINRAHDRINGKPITQETRDMQERATNNLENKLNALKDETIRQRTGISAREYNKAKKIPGNPKNRKVIDKYEKYTKSEEFRKDIEAGYNEIKRNHINTVNAIADFDGNEKQADYVKYAQIGKQGYSAYENKEFASLLKNVAKSDDKEYTEKIESKLSGLKMAVDNNVSSKEEFDQEMKSFLDDSRKIRAEHNLKKSTKDSKK